MSEGNDGPCYETTASSHGHTGPQCAMQDTKESDLVSLEKRSERVLQNVRGVKNRLTKLLDGITRAEQCETDCAKDIQPQPKNRISSIENCIGFIDNESEQLNAIICELEDILK